MKFTAYDHIKRWEGLELKAYQDVGGVWTIGYGHTKTAKAGMEITLEEAKTLLDNDLEWVINTINNLVSVPLSQNQFNALCMFIYNIGATNFNTSTALKRLNSGDYAGCAEAMTWWNKVKGKKVQGLVNRREAEKELFLTPDVPVKPTPPPTKDEYVEAVIREAVERIVKYMEQKNV